MKPTINRITLAVDELRRSIKFYQFGLGLPTRDGVDHAIIDLNGNLALMLIRRAEFTELAWMAKQTHAPRGTTECILSYFASSQEEVDTLLRRAVDAGGVLSEAPNQKPWGYAGYIKDPDGHIWEIMWNPRLP